MALLPLKDWQTWVVHGLVSAGVTWATASLGVDDWLSAAFAVWGYTFRELDQLLRKLVREWDVQSRQFAERSRRYQLRMTLRHWRRKTRWLDVGMDVAAAVIGAGLVASWLT